MADDDTARAGSGLFEKMAEAYEREGFLDGLRERERKILDAFGDCTCADAPMCGWFRRPGDLFADGLPECVRLP